MKKNEQAPCRFTVQQLRRMNSIRLNGISWDRIIKSTLNDGKAKRDSDICQKAGIKHVAERVERQNAP